jgi:hypothetical protein
MASEGEAFSNGDESIDEDELLEALEQEEDEWDGAVAAPAPASDVARPKQSFESLGLYSHKSSKMCSEFHPVTVLGTDFGELESLCTRALTVENLCQGPTSWRALWVCSPSHSFARCQVECARASLSAARLPPCAPASTCCVAAAAAALPLRRHILVREHVLVKLISIAAPRRLHLRLMLGGDGRRIAVGAAHRQQRRALEGAIL